MVTRIRTIFLLLVLYASLPLFLMATNPDSLPLPLLIVPFVLIFMSAAMTILLLLRVFRSEGELFVRRRVFYAVIVAAIPTLLAVLQSLHQLNAKDVLITFTFIAGLSFYLTRLGFFRQ